MSIYFSPWWKNKMTAVTHYEIGKKRFWSGISFSISILQCMQYKLQIPIQEPQPSVFSNTKEQTTHFLKYNTVQCLDLKLK